MMDVRFGTDQLRRAYEDRKVRTRAWGEKIGRLYVQRVDALYAAPDVAAIANLAALALHALRGDWKGYHAIRLDGFYRLILRFDSKVPNVVTVVEVSKHYGD